MDPAALTTRWVEWGTPEYWQSVDLRLGILRLPLGLDFTNEQLRAEVTDHHLTTWIDYEIAGCLVLTPLSGLVVQMRQVAVLRELRRAGIGTMMVIESERLAASLGFNEMILHGREVATGFYDRLGYRRRGEEFIEVGIPHFEMCKTLTKPIS
jgi:predicted GNAT family N-acyltransferase